MGEMLSYSQMRNINSTSAHTQCVIHRVSQDTILGPLLFFIFINDLFLSAINKYIIMYADDISLVNIFEIMADPFTEIHIIMGNI